MSEKSTNVMAIVGFVLSFFFSIVGLICSIVGYRKADEYGGDGKGLALAGIIISSLSLVVVLIIIVAYIAITAAAFTALSVGIVL